MKGPSRRRESAWIGAVLLNNSKDPIEYFFCKEPIDYMQKKYKLRITTPDHTNKSRDKW